eukprot:g955.t1
MPGKNTSSQKEKRRNVRHFRLVQKPVLDDGDDQKNYLQPFFPTNVRKHLGDAVKNEEDAEAHLFKPLPGMEEEASRKIFGVEGDDDEEDEDSSDLDEDHADVGGSSCGKMKCGQNKKNRAYNARQEAYVHGADYDSEVEEDYEDDEHENAEEQGQDFDFDTADAYFPDDGYDYSRHLRVMDDRFVHKATETSVAAMKKDANVGRNKMNESGNKKVADALLKNEGVCEMDGMTVANLDEVRKEVLAACTSSAEENAGRVQQIDVMKLDRNADEYGEKPKVVLPADVLAALDGTYEDLPEEAAGDAFQEWDDFFGVAGGVGDNELLDQVWGKEGAEFARIERVRTGRGILKPGESLFGKIAEEGEDDADDDDEEEFCSDEEEDAEDVLDQALYDEIDELQKKVTAVEDAAPETLAEFRLRQMLEDSDRGYGDDNIGELDPTDVAGTKTLDDGILDHLLDEYLEQKATVKKFWQEEMLTLNPGTGPFGAPGAAGGDSMGKVPLAKFGCRDNIEIDPATGKPVIYKEQFGQALEFPEEKGFRDSKKSRRMKTLTGKTRLGPGLLDCEEDYASDADEVEKELATESETTETLRLRLPPREADTSDWVVVTNEKAAEEKLVLPEPESATAADSDTTTSTPATTAPTAAATGKSCSFYEKPTKDVILARVERMALEEPDYENETEEQLNRSVLKLMGYKEKKGVEFDCETILSTRSNLSNHPGKIVRLTSAGGKGKKKGKNATSCGVLRGANAGAGSSSLSGSLAGIAEGDENEDESTDAEEESDEDEEESEDEIVLELPEKRTGKKPTSVREEGFLRLLWNTIDYDFNNYIDTDELVLIVGAMRLCFYSVFYFGETSDRWRYKAKKKDEELAGRSPSKLGFSSTLGNFLGGATAGTNAIPTKGLNALQAGAVAASEASSGSVAVAAGKLMNRGGFSSPSLDRFKRAVGADGDTSGVAGLGRNSGAQNGAGGNTMNAFGSPGAAGGGPLGRQSDNPLDFTPSSTNENLLVPPQSGIGEIREPTTPLPDDEGDMERLQRRLDMLGFRISRAEQGVLSPEGGLQAERDRQSRPGGNAAGQSQDREAFLESEKPSHFGSNFLQQQDDVNFLAEQAGIDSAEMEKATQLRYLDSGQALVDELIASLRQPITSELRISEIVKELSFRGLAESTSFGNNGLNEALQSRYPGFFDSFLNNVILQGKKNERQIIASHRAILDSVDEVYEKLQKKVIGGSEAPILWPEFVDMLRPLCRREIDEDLLYAALPLHLLVQDCLRKKEFTRLDTAYSYHAKAYAEAYKMKLKRPVMASEQRSTSPVLKTGENLPHKWFLGKQKGQKVSQLSPLRRSPADWTPEVSTAGTTGGGKKVGGAGDEVDVGGAAEGGPLLSPTSAGQLDSPPGSPSSSASHKKAGGSKKANFGAGSSANLKSSEQGGIGDQDLRTSKESFPSTLEESQAAQPSRPKRPDRPFPVVSFLRFSSRLGDAADANARLRRGASGSDMVQHDEARCFLDECRGDAFSHGPPILSKRVRPTSFSAAPGDVAGQQQYRLSAPVAVGANERAEDRPGMIALWSFPGFLDLFKTRMRSRHSALFAAGSDAGSFDGSPARSVSLSSFALNSGPASAAGASSSSPSKPKSAAASGTTAKGKGGGATAKKTRPGSGAGTGRDRSKSGKLQLEESPIEFKIPPELFEAGEQEDKREPLKKAHADRDGSPSKSAASGATSGNPPFVVQHCANVYGLAIENCEVLGKRREEEGPKFVKIFNSISDGSIYGLRGEGPASELHQLDPVTGDFAPILYDERACGPWSAKQYLNDVGGSILFMRPIPQKSKPLQGLFQWRLELVGPAGDAADPPDVDVARGNSKKVPACEPEVLLQSNSNTNGATNTERLTLVGAWRDTYAFQHDQTTQLYTISASDLKACQALRQKGETGLKLQPLYPLLSTGGMMRHQVREFCCGKEFAGWVEGENKVFLVGCNDFGQCGVDPQRNFSNYLQDPCGLKFMPAGAGGGLSQALLEGSGSTSFGPRRIAQFQLGAEFGVILAAGTNSIFTWGRGESGQLGNGNFGISHLALEITRPVPNQVAYAGQLRRYFFSQAVAEVTSGGEDGQTEGAASAELLPREATEQQSLLEPYLTDEAQAHVEQAMDKPRASIHVGASTVLFKTQEVWAIWGRVTEFNLCTPLLMPAVELEVLLSFRGFYKDADGVAGGTKSGDRDLYPDIHVNQHGIVVQRKCLLVNNQY